MYGPGGGPKMTRTLPVAALFLIVLLAALASVVLMPRGGAPDIYLSAPDWQAPQPAEQEAYFVDQAELAVWEAEVQQFLAQPPVQLAIDPVVDPYLGFGQTAVSVTRDDGTIALMPDPEWVINMSVNHGDRVIQVPGRNGSNPVEVGDQSLLVMKAVVAKAQRLGGRLCPRGDCRSNGSVNLFLAKQQAYPQYGYLVIQLVEGRGVFFVVLRAPLESTNSLPPSGALPFGDGSYINSKSLKWLCAWVAGERIPGQNGHGVQGVPVTIGRGFDQWWARVITRYNPLIQITSMEVYIPPILAEFIVK